MSFLLSVVGWRLAVGHIAYRLDRVLRRLKVLRFLECAEKVQGSKVRRFGPVPFTALPSPHGEGGAVGDG